MSNYSDYWLDDDDIYQDDIDVGSSVNFNLIKLAVARRAVSNFVNILTGKSVPVYFTSEGKDNCTDGKTVYLSADILDKSDFDPAVGLALHEGSHVVLSDFDLIKTIWTKVDRSLYDLAQPLQISKDEVAVLVKTCLNYVEDRYIDWYVYNNAPGYRGYYLALYEKFFDSPKIKVMLQSNLYRVPCIESYETRMINFTNEHTDLDALPGLRDIAKVINLSNIQRLSTPKDRFNVAMEVAKIILSNITEHKKKDSGESGDGLNGEGESVDDVLGGKNTDPVPNDVKNDSSFDPDVSDNKNKQIKKAIQKQKDFLNGNIKKKRVNKKEKKILDAIEQSGMTLVKSGSDYLKSDGYYSVDTILVTKLTKELIETDVFPLKYVVYNHHTGRYDSTAVLNQDNQKAVNAGLVMGAALGRKLQIRSEVNNTKYMRKPVGKIDRRILSELSFDNENVFHTIDVSKYKHSYIHISVDASSSMRGDKWTKTITSVVAICKAASMIDNLRVTVSFRTTFNSSNSNCSSNPYVIIGYDSAVDKISKIKSLFPYLHPNGSTPEGLSYEAIMKHLPKTSVDSDYYFLNFSDGEPAMNYTTQSGDRISYSQESAALHTKKQVTKIKSQGYSVLSYFIKNDDYL
ncbi:MAG: hypothetical protein EB127_21445, partial [Alphaproteobacteria bacterium]|nr:hypothetical protein [Alphaproteobacteria bacterium]